MAKHIFLAFLLMFTLPVHGLEAQGETQKIEVYELAEQSDDEVKVPAKDAHENPQKWVNIILTFILIFAVICLTAVAIIIRKSQR